MINLVVNGVPYTDFVSATANISMESMANDFEFVASAVDTFPPFKQGDSVEVYIEGEKKITGSIDEVSGSDREGDHSVTYSGRDRTADFIDSDIDDLGDINASESLTLKRLIEIIIDNIGSNISVIDNVNPEPFNVAEDKIRPEAGDNAFEFVMKFARKRQCLLSSNGDGNIVITQSSPTDSNAYVQRLNGFDNNNIIDQEWSISGSEVHNLYINRGQIDPIGLNFSGETSVDMVTDQSGRYTNKDIRAGRQRVVVETESYSSDQLKSRAKWSSQLAKARSVKFNCTVKGHTSSAGEIWKENTLVQVSSDTADIHRKMLLTSISFSEGEGLPATSSLDFVEKNVYTINDKILAQKPTGEQNDAFSDLG